jgi:hypothetical protein
MVRSLVEVQQPAETSPRTRIWAQSAGNGWRTIVLGKSTI